MTMCNISENRRPVGERLLIRCRVTQPLITVMGLQVLQQCFQITAFIHFVHEVKGIKIFIIKSHLLYEEPALLRTLISRRTRRQTA